MGLILSDSDGKTQGNRKPFNQIDKKKPGILGKDSGRLDETMRIGEDGIVISQIKNFVGLGVSKKGDFRGDLFKEYG